MGQGGALTKARAIPFNVLTQLKCLNCGSIHTRPHKEGDYIFSNIEEKCPNCGGTAHMITAIYIEEQKKQGPR
ncbi:MAG: hypothetical protein QW580_02585 [Nitrososphaerota archaeon]